MGRDQESSYFKILQNSPILVSFWSPSTFHVRHLRESDVVFNPSNPSFSSFFYFPRKNPSTTFILIFFYRNILLLIIFFPLISHKNDDIRIEWKSLFLMMIYPLWYLAFWNLTHPLDLLIFLSSHSSFIGIQFVSSIIISIFQRKSSQESTSDQKSEWWSILIWF